MVKIVTDSCSDIPPSLARELGITVVPLYVKFENASYRDNIDISTEEFYRELQTTKAVPTTSSVTPEFFAELFTNLAEETDEILTITLSALYAGTYEAALRGRTMVSKDCQIEVIDSQLIVGGEMLLAISAARKAQEGASLDLIVEWVRKATHRIHQCMTFHTLEYLRKGGRIGKAESFLGSMLKVHPILGVKYGNTFPIARRRNRTQARQFLVDFVSGFQHIEALAIEDATTPDELDILAERIKDMVPPERTYRSKVSPVVGTHVGPDVLAVSVLEAE